MPPAFQSPDASFTNSWVYHCSIDILTCLISHPDGPIHILRDQQMVISHNHSKEQSFFPGSCCIPLTSARPV